MKRFAAILAVAAALMLVSTTALAWFAAVEGRPGAFGGAEKGLFIWHDDEGMHIRGISRHHTTVYSGTVRTNGRFVGVHERRLEAGDHLYVDGDRDTLRFRFTVRGGTDGVDFRVHGGNRLHFELHSYGHSAHPGEIYVGREGWHPGDNRFTLWR